MADEDNNSGKFAFKFGKSSAPKKLTTSVIADEVKEENLVTTYVASFDGKEQNRSKEEDVKKTLVIPLIEANRWRIRDKAAEKDAKVLKRKFEDSKELDDVKSEKSPDAVESEKSEKEDINSQAIKELVSDAYKQNEDWEERGDPGISKILIPLLLKNKVPEGFEADEGQLDVTLRPEGSNEADYDSVPVEAFGFAMLRGMGWKDGEGIGKDKKLIDQMEPGLRPKGLGLGADRSAAKKNGKKSKSTDENEEELEMKKGTHCQVQSGHHADLYGQIIGLDEDNARVMVKMTIGGETLNLLQYSVRLVSKTEYDKYAKYINKSKVDKFKEKEEKERTREMNGSGRDDKKRHRHKSPHDERSSSDRDSRHRERDRDHSRDRDSERHRDRDSERHRGKDSERHKGRDSERHRDRDSERHRERDSDRHRDQDRDTDRHRDEHRDSERHRSRDSEKNRERNRNSDGTRDKYKESNRDAGGKNKDSSRQSSTSTGGPRLWIRPQCRVRIVDKKYKSGKYYKEKVVVVDVMGEDNCLCKTDNGKLLDGLSQAMLETVIPKSDPAYVVLVGGKYCGQLAEMIQKDKLDCVATVQLLTDRDIALKLGFDSICEYVGDIDAEMDY